MSREARRDCWRDLVEKHAESGMSAAAFCNKQGVNPQRFYSWRKRFNGDKRATGFIRLLPTSKASGSGIRIILDPVMAVEVDRGFDALTLRQIVKALCAGD